MKELLGFAIGYGYLFAVIGIATVLMKTKLIKPAITRKLIHVFIAFTWIVLYKFFYGSLLILVMPVSFIIINALALKLGFFKAMEREPVDAADGKAQKKDYGTVYYAIAITLMMILCLFVPEFMLPSGVGVFCLSFGDGFAAIFGAIGSKYNYRLAKSKSLFGTLSCAVFAAIGIIILGAFVELGLTWYAVAVTAVITALLELVSGRLDNFAVSFGAMLSAYVFMYLI